ncbi:MAG: hypothetical protein DME02_04850 [Candidatus Rokuibacteriota bacterium]|nr:MAG: hypothetical protein DME02_04850 [Candidatus Rokubacteria bacterium]
MTTTNTPSTHTKNELLRELVIATGCVAMLLSGVGALYWIQTRPDEAAAGATVTTAAKAGAVKPTEMPKPKAGVPTPDAAVTHADIYFDFKSVRLRADAAKLLQDTAAAMTRTETWAVSVPKPRCATTRARSASSSIAACTSRFAGSASSARPCPPPSKTSASPEDQA